MIKKLLLFVVFIAVGFMAYSYRGTILNSFNGLSGVTQPIITTLQSAFNRVQTAWSTIPSTIQGIVLLGIPTAFATFFAWTKSRAMQQLQQTQLEAKAQLTQLGGEAIEQNQQIETLENQAIEYEEQVTSQITELGELKAELTSDEEIIKKLEKDIVTVRAEANALSHLDQDKVADLVVQKLRDARRVP